MKTETLTLRVYDFSFPSCDTLIRVEEHHDLITIRATRDNFNRRNRERFIHRLAAEGFIPDEFQWFTFEHTVGFPPLRWLIDYSWLTLDEADAVIARRFMVRLLVTSGVLWLGLMSSLFFYPGP